MHWRHYPPIWMSPSDYQSFIYFRAVSHKKKEYIKVSPVTVFCRAFYWSQFVGWHLWHEFSVFCGGVCHPCHPLVLRKKWIFISPSINNLLILDKKSNPFLPAFHFLCNQFTTRPLFMFVLVWNYSLFFDFFFFLRCKIIYPEINTKEISRPEIKTKRSESGPKRGE